MTLWTKIQISSIFAYKLTRGFIIQGQIKLGEQQMFEKLRSLKGRFSEAFEAGKEAYRETLRPTAEQELVAWVEKNSPPYTKSFWLLTQLEGILLETARAERDDCAKLMCPLCAARVKGRFDFARQGYLHKTPVWGPIACKAGTINFRRVSEIMPISQQTQ